VRQTTNCLDRGNGAPTRPFQPSTQPLTSTKTLLTDPNRLLVKPQVPLATAEIVARGRPRHEVQRDIKAKERAREALAKRYRWAFIWWADGWPCARACVGIGMGKQCIKDPR
jgi:hypothetical protein